MGRTLSPVTMYGVIHASVVQRGFEGKQLILCGCWFTDLPLFAVFWPVPKFMALSRGGGELEVEAGAMPRDTDRKSACARSYDIK